MKAELQLRGISVADLDLEIAATALTMSCSIVTNNTRHFSKIPGLKVENWTA